MNSKYSAYSSIKKTTFFQKPRLTSIKYEPNEIFYGTTMLTVNSDGQKSYGFYTYIKFSDILS